MNLKKIGKVFTSKFVGTGPSSYKKKNLPGRGLTKVEKHCCNRWLDTRLHRFLAYFKTNKNNCIISSYFSTLPYCAETIFCCCLATGCHVNNSVQATYFRRQDSIVLESQYKYRTYMRKRKKKCRLIKYKRKETSSKHKSCNMYPITYYKHSVFLCLE